MTDPPDPDAFPDETPLADAVEQARPAAEPADPVVPDDYPGPPLESDESDWQEQRLVVEDPDEDYDPQV